MRNKQASASRVLKKLEQELKTSAKKAKLIGASVAVFANGQFHAAQFGLANIETGISVTPQTLHQIGSISKVFTATLILKLVEEGVLELRTPIVEILPDLRLANAPVSKDIEILHLLTHTSGLELGDWQGNELGLTGRGDDCLTKYLSYCEDHILLTEPASEFPDDSTHYHYSNIGYILLGCIVERCTGQTWDEYLRQNIFVPLGLNHTTSLPEDAVRFPNAVGHLVDDSGANPKVVTPTYLARANGPAVGRICMTTEDLTAFAQAFLNRSGALGLTDSAIDTMLTSFVTVEKGRGQGLGWMLYDWDGVRVFGHDGGVPGQIASLRILPDHEMIVATFFNGGNAVAFAADFFSKLFDSLGGISYPPVSDAEIQHFATYMMQGNYDFPGKDVDVVDGRRVARSAAQTPSEEHLDG